MSDYVMDGHLGGYKLGGDPATYFPDLWRWLVDTAGVTSVLDVGCGEGHALQFFRNIGCTVHGVDGIEQPDPDVSEHDFTLGPWFPDRNFDLVWCCEFVEHVEERFMPNFLAAFRAAPLVLMTHADPGQDGYHHVNCRSSDYWMGALAGAGFLFDPDLTRQTRAIARFNPSPWNHYARAGLAFRASNADQEHS